MYLSNYLSCLCKPLRTGWRTDMDVHPIPLHTQRPPDACASQEWRQLLPPPPPPPLPQPACPPLLQPPLGAGRGFYTCSRYWGPSAIGTTPSRLACRTGGKQHRAKTAQHHGHGAAGTNGKSFETTLGGRGTSPGPATTTVGPPMAKLGPPQGQLGQPGLPQGQLQPH